MNVIWVVFMLSSLIAILFINPSLALSTITQSANNAVTFSIKMIAIYAFWLGIMELVDKTKLSDKLGCAIKPLSNKLFGNISSLANNYVTLNLSANILGLGNAATPMGISAVANMKDNTYALAMLMVINATSIQLLPTTVISLRSSAGSLFPSSIFFPTLISTIVSTIFGIILVAIFFRKYKIKVMKKHKQTPEQIPTTDFKS